VLLQALQGAVVRRAGVTVVTGGSAAARTAVCRALAESLPGNTFACLLLDPEHSETTFLERMLRDFGVVSRDQGRVGHRVDIAQSELVEALHRFLFGLPRINAVAVLIVDNADGLRRPVLRLLTDLARLAEQGQPLLQIVLTGGEGLEAILADPEWTLLDSCVTGRHTPKNRTRPAPPEQVRHPGCIARRRLRWSSPSC
jgi:type II secretory pathway predicted ATPase ExeA